MAGLSSLISVPRRIGIVSLAEMQKQVGVYVIAAAGGGGGGGGRDSFYGWYGRSGYSGRGVSPAQLLMPPFSVSAGGGGSVSAVPDQNGFAGGNTVVAHARGIINFKGGAGGQSSFVARLQKPDISDRTYFAYKRLSIALGTPSDHDVSVIIGMGGGSNSSGSLGGFVTAMRIG